jgi:hypothetical protein
VIDPTATFQVQARGVNRPRSDGAARPSSMPTKVALVVARRVRTPRRKAPTVGPEA